MFTPMSPSEASSRYSSGEKCSSRSKRAAWGATRSRANLRAVSRMSVWVSESSRFTEGFLLDGLEVERILDGVGALVGRRGEVDARQHVHHALVEPLVLERGSRLGHLGVPHEAVRGDGEGRQDAALLHLAALVREHFLVTLLDVARVVLHHLAEGVRGEGHPVDVRRLGPGRRGGLLLRRGRGFGGLLLLAGGRTLLAGRALRQRQARGPKPPPPRPTTSASGSSTHSP